MNSSANFIRITTDRNALSLDSAYEQLKEMYPEYFTDEYLSPSDRLVRINDVMSTLKQNREISARDYYSEKAAKEIEDQIFRELNKGYYQARSRALRRQENARRKKQNK